MIGHSTLMNLFNKPKSTTFLLSICLLSTANAALAEDDIACLNAVRAGEFERALSIANTLIKSNPSNRAAYLCKGKVQNQTNQSNEALATFEIAEKDTIGRLLPDLGDGQWNIQILKKLLEDILPKHTFFKGNNLIK
jgi:hypothetical protein